MSVGYLLPLLLQTGRVHRRRLRLLRVQGLPRLLRLQRLLILINFITDNRILYASVLIGI